MKKIYLDYAAATPVDKRVLAAMEPFFARDFYNPSATYLASRTVRNKLSLMRASIAGLLGAKPGEIIFTAGATEANNLAIAGIMRQFPKAEVLVSSIEHESVVVPANVFKHRQIPVTGKGVVDVDKLEAMISDSTVLVSVMLVNNELGTIQPIREISAALQNIRKSRAKAKTLLPIYLHTDAAQAGNYLDLHTSRLGVDMMSINGGKIYGPKQSGALFIRAGVKLLPLILGGGQELGLRSGTENVAAIVGLTKSLEIAQAKRSEETQRITKLREQLERGIETKFEEAVINGRAKHRAPHILSVSFAGVDNERLMFQLDELGIMVAVGSACSASSDEPSQTLSAIGLSGAEARSTIRFSLGKYTTEKEVKRTLKSLAKLIP